jgi:hypothetical protein
MNRPRCLTRTIYLSVLWTCGRSTVARSTTALVDKGHQLKPLTDLDTRRNVQNPRIDATDLSTMEKGAKGMHTQQDRQQKTPLCYLFVPIVTPVNRLRIIVSCAMCLPISTRERQHSQAQDLLLHPLTKSLCRTRRLRWCVPLHQSLGRHFRFPHSSLKPPTRLVSCLACRRFFRCRITFNSVVADES